MKRLIPFALSASLLCAGQSPILQSDSHMLSGTGPVKHVKPRHSHRKLYMLLVMSVATSLATYEAYSHTHSRRLAGPTLPNPPQPGKPDLFIITCGVCRGMGN